VLQPPGIFDQLRAWALLPTDELPLQFDAGSAATLAACAALLLARPFVASKVTKVTFPDQVALLRRELGAGSRALGEALISAGAFKDSGNVCEASRVLRSFAEHCSASFYRAIALQELARLDARNGT
jgi:hypothetical protein